MNQKPACKMHKYKTSRRKYMRKYMIEVFMMKFR